MKFFTILFLASVLFCCGKINKRAVEGHVMNPVTGLPIEGVKMSLVKTTNGLPGGEKTIGSAVTDANGYYKIEEKSMKAVYLQVNTFGNYHPIGWFKDGSYSGGNNFPIEKGDVQTVDFHAVPYGNLQRHVKNISCFNTFDEIKLYYDGASKANYGYNIGMMTTLTGCIDITTNPLKMTSDYHYFHWAVTKNGLTNTYYDTIFVNASGVTNLDIFY